MRAWRRSPTSQSAIGIKHPTIVQRVAGLHGRLVQHARVLPRRRGARLRVVKHAFLLLAFVVPLALLLAGRGAASPPLLLAAFLVQYGGLLAERWFFFAQANHPQNLYYQAVS